MITFDPILDTAALMAAPAQEKLAMVNAYRVHFDPTNKQATREAGERFFTFLLLPYVCGRPN